MVEAEKIKAQVLSEVCLSLLNLSLRLKSSSNSKGALSREF